VSLDTRLNDIHAKQKELSVMQEQLLTRLESGNGGGGSGGTGLKDRISRLESQFDKLRDDNVTLRDRIGSQSERLTQLIEKVSHLPSKGYIDARLLGLLVLIAAFITFGEKLQALVR